ncbi:DUF1800 domain-containing protein [Pseudoflavitalea sp. X16]|uniref:DUF1800 domain-containing protein n=1 Tax=Paraflavitalea devenefica TaxID=2716334 RepID=UPI0014236741|nr:DUF1800 domain-containing protein [Paraflavitalea devenefica]NII28529.1 DUF1800 domain-containing protein [Paraflavitalea devenefica]
MKNYIRIFYTSFAVLVTGVLLCSFFLRPLDNSSAPFSFPYKKAKLTERQAAAHLLNRFTFGARPGDVDAVVNMGLEKWFRQQLEAKLPDDTLTQLLGSYDALKLSNDEIADIYPRGGQLVRMAIRDGYIHKDSVNASDKKGYKDQLQRYMDEKGLKPMQELYRQLANQKILRATYGENQLQEVLTDFWFNHFNVSLTKNDCGPFVMAYERDAIRPNVLGNFETMLMATAKSPAMLYYLDNFTSMGENMPPANPRTAKAQQQFDQRMEAMESDTSAKAMALKKAQQLRKTRGLNENYAREVMELHTLGVDGGYTQQDVTQAAKILTGWTVYPLNDYGANAARKQLERLGEEKMQKQGYVREGDFLFAANRHDKSAKTVLGKPFKANGGYEEGVELLHMLAHHPSTAKFIARKLAVRFVNDNPPQSLIDKMAQTFLAKEGNIREVLITMATSPEFWSKEALREKTKSPFELAISSVRNLNATITQPYQLYTWVSKMGQRMYYYQAPTGFPDNGKYWINTGSLLNRMNFGLALASNRIPGITVDLYALNNHREPESAEAALETYGKMIMPERDLEASIKRLTPLLNDPELGKKVDEAAGKTTPPQQQTTMMQDNEENTMTEMDETTELMPKKKGGGKKNPNKIPKNPAKNNYAMQYAKGNNNMLSQVVGIIIGSPEFQRK